MLTRQVGTLQAIQWFYCTGRLEELDEVVAKSYMAHTHSNQTLLHFSPKGGQVLFLRHVVLRYTRSTLQPVHVMQVIES